MALRVYVGRNDLIVSLGAKSLTGNGTMERYQAANDDCERLVSQARKVFSGSFDELDSARIAWLAET